MAPVMVDALVEVTQWRLQPQPLEERLRPAKQRPRRAREEQEPEHECPEHEHAFEPQVAAHVVLPDREQEPDRSEGHRRRASDAALEEHGPRDDRRPPRMPPRRLDDADRVAAERRREHLTGRVCDEVRAREPGHALEDVVRSEEPAPAQREHRDGDDHDRHGECEPREVRVREDVERRAELDLPDQVRDRRGGQDERPDLTRPPTHRPRTSSVSSS